MAGQAKNVIQAEIDAACELIDFFTFNVQSALELEQSQALSPDKGTVAKYLEFLEFFFYHFEHFLAISIFRENLFLNLKMS